MTVLVAMQPGTSAIQLAAESGGGGGGATSFLLLLGVLVFAYLILVRPQRKRMKQLQQTQASLSPGAEVMTTAGLYATVVDFDDQTVTLETAPGVHNRYIRAAVAKIITPDDSFDEAVDDADDETEDEPDDEAVEDDGDAQQDASRPER